jgi:CheY-like chemotaxis protein
VTIRLLVADDQALVRAGLRMLLGAQPDLEVVGEAVDGADAVAKVEALAPDVVLMDVRMPGVDGVTATRRLVEAGLVGRETAAGGFSLGMAQRLGLAAALLADPRALLLDEPANGLDPHGVAWLRGLLRAAAGDRTVLVSSHLLGEMEVLADHVVVVGRAGCSPTSPWSGSSVAPAATGCRSGRPTRPGWLRCWLAGAPGSSGPATAS